MKKLISILFLIMVFYPVKGQHISSLISDKFDSKWIVDNEITSIKTKTTFYWTWRPFLHPKQTTKICYNKAGRIKLIGKAVVVETFDSLLNTKTKKINYDNSMRITKTKYDSIGNITEMNEGNQKMSNYYYDSKNRLYKKTTHDIHNKDTESLYFYSKDNQLDSIIVYYYNGYFENGFQGLNPTENIAWHYNIDQEGFLKSIDLYKTKSNTMEYYRQIEYRYDENKFPLEKKYFEVLENIKKLEMIEKYKYYFNN